MKKILALLLLLSACSGSYQDENVNQVESDLSQSNAIMGIIRGTVCPAGTADALLLAASDSPAGTRLNSVTLHQSTSDSGSIKIGPNTAIANVTPTEMAHYCSVLNTETSSCIVPAVSGMVGTLPPSMPNLTPSGYITAIIGNGTSVLQVSYQTVGNVTQIFPISSGNSAITFSGGWQKNGNITSIITTANTISINNGQGIITVSGATLSGQAIWNGLNSGVTQIVGGGNVLIFNGYNANSGNEQLTLKFLQTCNTEAQITFFWAGTGPDCPNQLCSEVRSPTIAIH